MRDLHEITRAEGVATVAALVGLSPRALLRARAGESPLSVDTLYQLVEGYPDFDLLATVRRVGRARLQRVAERRVVGAT